MLWLRASRQPLVWTLPIVDSDSSSQFCSYEPDQLQKKARLRINHDSGSPFGVHAPSAILTTQVSAMSLYTSPTISERGGPPFSTFTMPHLPPRQPDPGPVRRPEMMWLHWTINLLSWIIDCIHLHPVVLQPVPPMDQFRLSPLSRISHRPDAAHPIHSATGSRDSP